MAKFDVEYFLKKFAYNSRSGILLRHTSLHILSCGPDGTSDFSAMWLIISLLGIVCCVALGSYLEYRVVHSLLHSAFVVTVTPSWVVIVSAASLSISFISSSVTLHFMTLLSVVRSLSDPVVVNVTVHS